MENYSGYFLDALHTETDRLKEQNTENYSTDMLLKSAFQIELRDLINIKSENDALKEHLVARIKQIEMRYK